jgi:hypothetical protein
VKQEDVAQVDRPKDNPSRWTVRLTLLNQPVEVLQQQGGSAAIGSTPQVRVEFLGEGHELPSKPEADQGSASLGSF